MSGRVAAWIAVTVVAPLMFFDVTHRWEEDQDVGSALLWTLVALPVLAATIRARSLLAGTAISLVFLAASAALYRWIIPLSGEADWLAVWGYGLLGAVAGAAIGLRFRERRLKRPGYVAGVLTAVAGVLLAPVVVRLGAEDSTIQYDEGRYGEVTGTVELPAAGRYAIMAMGFSPRNPDCRVGGRQVEKVSIPPADYGGDFATYAWVATFTVPAPGAYTLSCDTGDDDASYTVGDVPRIRGAVASMIHWPVVIVGLLGGIPGLVIIASRYVRRPRLSRPG
ncbi:hypothetical protein ACTI_50500 [Actinoplanes sp. OR16]|uniref:hypothetical protein n=1 Tax=Actinoplanes sp. OR16 TaxID=946334 RepID=UPI000F6C2069|nr:hypothetical protein [Actinoplanes sp. OR16]BBH68365.1 hypothetical protein ACTI_50500 [Actinoplanes sp. OR16]